MSAPSEWTWLDAHRAVGEAELAHMCQLTVAELEELVDYGALVPLAGPVRQFSAACIAPLREASRLRGYYDLDLFTVSLVLGYLQRIDATGAAGAGAAGAPAASAAAAARRPRDLARAARMRRPRREPGHAAPTASPRPGAAATVPRPARRFRRPAIR